jgi:hypothetical protein
MNSHLTYFLAQQRIADLMAEAKRGRTARPLGDHRSSRLTGRFAAALRSRRVETPQRMPLAADTHQAASWTTSCAKTDR